MSLEHMQAYVITKRSPPMDYSVAIDPLHGQWTILYSHSIDVP